MCQTFLLQEMLSRVIICVIFFSPFFVFFFATNFCYHLVTSANLVQIVVFDACFVRQDKYCSIISLLKQNKGSRVNWLDFLHKTKLQNEQYHFKAP